MRKVIQKLIKGQHLTQQEARNAMDKVLDNGASPAQVSAYLMLLRAKGETVEEIIGSADMLKEKAFHIQPRVGNYVDLVGTGGDGANTFNISTTAAFVTAGAGVPVAKHGNRAISSRSGSVDVLEALGIYVDLSPEQVERCVEQNGIGFMFARSFHPKMKTVSGVRAELGVRTIFNILGPLSNPSNAKYQVIGVFDAALTQPLAEAMMGMGVERGMVFSCQGVDELTTVHKNHVSEIRNGQVSSYTIDALQYGLQKATFDDLAGGTAQENALITRSILEGQTGPRRDTVLLNAAASIYVQGTARNMKEGVEMAATAIDNGAAKAKLDAVVAFSNSCKQEAAQ